MYQYLIHKSLNYKFDIINSKDVNFIINLLCGININNNNYFYYAIKLFEEYNKELINTDLIHAILYYYDKFKFNINDDIYDINKIILDKNSFIYKFINNNDKNMKLIENYKGDKINNYNISLLINYNILYYINSLNKLIINSDNDQICKQLLFNQFNKTCLIENNLIKDDELIKILKQRF